MFLNVILTEKNILTITNLKPVFAYILPYILMQFLSTSHINNFQKL